MASEKLTVAMRESIAREMIKHRFCKEAAKLVKERAALARAVYDDLYKAKDRKLIESLPKGWLPESSSIRVRFAESYEEIEFSGHNYNFKAYLLKPEPVLLPLAWKHRNSCVASYDAGHRLSIRHAELTAKTNELFKRIYEAEAQIDGALDSVTTTGKLREVWPEAAPFVAKYEKPASPKLPAIPVASLNAMLNLPVAA